jgi:hypothetical protein
MSDPGEEKPRAKGRRIGGTVSTLTDATAPEAFTTGRNGTPAAPPPSLASSPAESRNGDRPRAEDLVAPRAGDVPREQVNGSTPAVLQLRRRMTLYRLDHGLELRDQVALALDQWLRSQGY